MSIKVILVVLVLVAILVVAAFFVGHMRGKDAGDLACVTQHAGDAAAYQAKETRAQKLARDAQHKADMDQLNQLQHLLIQAQDAAASASAVAAAAKERSKNLSATLARLQHENVDVSKWSAGCLPPALLASLHPEASTKDYPIACRRAGGGDKGSISGVTSQPATGH